VKIAVVGAVAVDQYVILQSFPEDDTMVFAERSFRAIGGCGANISINLALQNLEVHLFCGVGRDDVSTKIIDFLSKLGVQLHYQSEGKTALNIVLLNKDGCRRIISFGGNALFQSYDDTPYSGYDVICVADSFPAEACKALRSESRIRIYSPGGCGLHFGEDEVRRVARFATITILSAKEASRITGYNELSQYVIVTSGRQPTMLYVEGNLLSKLEVNPVDNVIDTTGAGDAFVSGLIFSLVAGEDIYQAIETGHTWAARVIQKYGANLSSEYRGLSE